MERLANKRQFINELKSKQWKGYMMEKEKDYPALLNRVEGQKRLWQKARVAVQAILKAWKEETAPLSSSRITEKEFPKGNASNIESANVSVSHDWDDAFLFRKAYEEAKEKIRRLEQGLDLKEPKDKSIVFDMEQGSPNPFKDKEEAAESLKKPDPVRRSSETVETVIWRPYITSYPPKEKLALKFQSEEEID